MNADPQDALNPAILQVEHDDRKYDIISLNDTVHSTHSLVLQQVSKVETDKAQCNCYRIITPSAFR